MKRSTAISVVVVHRNADVLGIITVKSAVNGVTMKETVAQERNGIARFSEPELTFAPQSANAPDPRLIEFVRLLARRAAREWYEQIAEERHPKRF
jgi:hypothetical protein